MAVGSGSAGGAAWEGIAPTQDVPTYEHVLTPGTLGWGHLGMRCPTLSEPLGYCVGPLLGGLVVLGLVGSGSRTQAVSGWQGRGRASELSALVPGGPLPYGRGGSVQGLSSGWMRSCLFGGLPEFCAAGTTWVLGSISACF